MVFWLHSKDRFNIWICTNFLGLKYTEIKAVFTKYAVDIDELLLYLIFLVHVKKFLHVLFVISKNILMSWYYSTNYYFS